MSPFIALSITAGITLGWLLAYSRHKHLGVAVHLPLFAMTVAVIITITLQPENVSVPSGILFAFSMLTIRLVAPWVLGTYESRHPNQEASTD